MKVVVALILELRTVRLEVHQELEQVARHGCSYVPCIVREASRGRWGCAAWWGKCSLAIVFVVSREVIDFWW